MNARADSRVGSSVAAFAVSPDNTTLFFRSSLYREFLAERDEILRHKWYESEKAGHDIGFENALASWVVHHRAKWLKARRTRTAVA
jgi:hypothetical protein